MRNQIMQPFGLSRLGGHGNVLPQLTGSMTLTETGLDAAPVLQQGGAGYAFGGTYSLSGDPTGLEWRVGDSAWYPLQAVTASGGTWSGTAAPPSGLYRQGPLQVRPTNSGTVTPATSSMNVTVTDVIIIDGQSNADGAATNLQSYGKTNFDFLSANATAEFAVTTTDPIGNSAGSAWPALAEQLDQDGIPPAIFLPVTVDGTGFEDGAGSWSLTGNGASPGTSYTLHVSRVNARLAKTGGAAALIWVQGEQDTTSAAYADAWDTEFAAMVAQLRLDIPYYAAIPVIVPVVGEVNSGDFETEWRVSAYNVIDGESLVHEGPNHVGEVFGDGTHYGIVGGGLDTAAAEAQLDRIAAMHKRVLDRVLYGDTDTGAATASSYSLVDANTIRVTFDRDVANHADTTGWAASDAEGPLTITSSAQGPTAASVDLTVAQTLYGAVTVSFGAADTASGGTLQDTHALAPMPPRVITDAAAGTGAGAAPSQDSAPTLDGAPQEGVVLTATSGSYSGAPTPSVVSYQWEISDDGVTGWSDIVAATGAIYTPVSADVGKYLRRGETVSNAVGSSEYFTAASAAVLSASSFADPSDLAATVEWWKADTGITQDGNGVSAWASALGGGTQLAQASTSFRPKTTTRTLNGAAILDFDGANDHINAAQSTVLPLFAIQAGDGVDWYGRLGTAGGTDFTLVTASSVSRTGPGLWEVAFDATANTATLSFGGVQIAQATDYTGTQDAHVFVVADIDGTTHANRTMISNNATTGFVLARDNGLNFGDAGIAEIAVCNDVVSGSDLADMRGYFNTAWGL